ncbi:MAG: SHOCT domain-containing protein [Burkholderiales bacterium]
MDCTQWWGQGFHGFWIFPIFFMILMAVFFAFMTRRAGGWHRGHAHGQPWGPGTGWGPDRAPWAQSTGGETARQVLDRRYAAGEITKEQYDVMKLDIESK